MGTDRVVSALGLVALVAIAPGPLGAEEPPVVAASPVVVSASSPHTLPVQMPGNMTVITQDEIGTRPYPSPVDLLRQIPGVHIDQPGGRGSVSSMYVRGSDPNFTVVLIDGVKVNDPTNSRGGSFDFSTLDPAIIDRIEIVRGPLASLYGSGAMGGVVNIVTRGGGDEREASLAGSTGSHGFYRGVGDARGPLGPGFYSLTAAYADDGHPVPGSRFTGQNLAGRLDFALTSAATLDLVTHYAHSRKTSFPDDSGGPQFATLRELDQREGGALTLGAGLEHRIRDWWQYALKVGYHDRTEDVRSPGVAPGLRDPFGIPPNRSEDTLRRLTLLAKTVLSIRQLAYVTAGVDVEREEGASDGALLVPGGPAAEIPTRFRLERTVYAPFAEIQLASSRGWTLYGGARVDVPDDFASRVSARAGGQYRVESTRTTVRVNWGEGFKLPSFFALANPIVGNPRLGPETSESLEVGVLQTVARGVEVGVTAFRSRFFDLVDLAEGPPPRLVNRSEVTARGVELTGDLVRFARLGLSAHLTYTETDIKGTDEGLRNRPKWRGGVRGRYRPRPDLVVGLGILYVGDVLDSSIPTGDRELGDYVRVDLSATWTPRPRWQLWLGVENALDARYEEAVGFPAPGIAVRIGVRVTL